MLNAMKHLLDTILTLRIDPSFLLHDKAFLQPSAHLKSAYQSLNAALILSLVALSSSGVKLSLGREKLRSFTSFIGIR